MVSPFDYRYYNAESALYRWCEELVTLHVWRRHYSKVIFGENDRPFMAAVSLDMIELVQYLALLNEKSEPRFLAELFKEFLKSQKNLATVS
jgi:hypothetical protein